MLYQIILPYAVFGIVVEQGVVTVAAPIARWSIGKTSELVFQYYWKRGAVIVEV